MTITITQVNDAPVAVNGALTTLEDTLATGTLVATDVDNDALTYTIVTNGTKGIATITNAATGAFTYTPTANANGTDSFTFKARDASVDSNVATLTITITPVNDAPVALNGALTTLEDTLATGTLVATDVDNDALTYAIVTNGSKGTATITNGATGAFTYTPAANANGTDTFTFKANDSTADSNTATVTITITPVNDAPVAVNGALTTPEDTLATGTLVATDVDNDALTYAIVTNGSKGTATITNAATGAFSYTPAANANGTDTFTFKARDGSIDSNIATVTITITAVNDAPVAANGALTTLEDTFAIGTLVATDVDNDALTYTIVTNGTKGIATITNAATGAFTYTPAANANGTDTFTFKANDSTVDSNTATVTITITPVNDAPVAVNGALTTPEDTAVAGTLLATDVDGNALTYAIVTNGSKGTATITNAATGAFTYAPAANANGTDTFTFKANDGTVDSNVATVTITISPVNDAPTAANGTLATLEDTSVTGMLAASDVDGDALTYAIVTNGTKGTATITNAATGAFTYTPNANANGTDTFTFKANDGTLDSNIATVTITITPVNDAPVATGQAVTTSEDTAAAIVLAATDPEGSFLTFDIVTPPAHGTLGGILPNVTYTPALDYYGPDSFTFKANDGSLDSNVATVSLMVLPVNDRPVAANDSYSTSEDTQLAVTIAAGLLSNDSDVDGDSLKVVLASGPSHGVLTLNANGSFTYVPAANFNGADSFTYTATDGALSSNVATVTITIIPVNDAPVADNQAVAVNFGTPTRITLVGRDPDNDVLTFQIVSGPIHGSLGTIGQTLTYTPGVRYSGTDAFTFRANDGQADSNVATVSITVASAPGTPTAFSQAVSLNEDTYANITLTASDPDGTRVRFAIVDGPAHGRLSGSGRSVTYIPAANYNGPDRFTFNVQDRDDLISNNAVVSITVIPVNDPPLASNLKFVTAKNTFITGQLVASDLDGDRMTYRIIEAPDKGTVTWSAVTGIFTYTPSRNSKGADRFTYVANDGKIDGNVATVQINIRDAAQDKPPVASDLQFESTRQTPFSARLVATDDDDDVLTYRLVGEAASGSVTIDRLTGVFTYSPNPSNKGGTDRFKYVANDGFTDSNTATVRIEMSDTKADREKGSGQEGGEQETKR